LLAGLLHYFGQKEVPDQSKPGVPYPI
jgi:hypothetical protein